MSSSGPIAVLVMALALVACRAPEPAGEQPAAEAGTEPAIGETVPQAGDSGLDPDASEPMADAGRRDVDAAVPTGAGETPPPAVAGKPMAPIAIRYVLDGEPRVGQQLGVAITVTPQAPMSAFSLELDAGAGLLLEPVPGGLQAPSISAAEPFVRTVTVTPLAEGTLHLGVVAAGEVSGQRQARGITISIRVGNARAASTERFETRKTDESGEALIVLPARETP